VRLDGGAKAFRQRWGYEPCPPPPLMEEEEGGIAEGDEDEDSSVADCASLREEGFLYSASPAGECPFAFLQVSRLIRNAFERFS
jgi:hypothetical protein